MSIDIDFKKLKKLVDLIENSQVSEIELSGKDGECIRVTKPGAQQHYVAPIAAQPPAAPTLMPSTPQVSAPSEEKAPAAPSGNAFKAPMIGTIYLSPSPDAAPFVKVGDKIEAGQTLCLIEAMKMFNKIKAEKSGTVQEILVDSSQAVEFDQPLFVIKEG